MLGRVNCDALDLSSGIPRLAGPSKCVPITRFRAIYNSSGGTEIKSDLNNLYFPWSRNRLGEVICLSVQRLLRWPLTGIVSSLWSKHQALLEITSKPLRMHRPIEPFLEPTYKRISAVVRKSKAGQGRQRGRRKAKARRKEDARAVERYISNGGGVSKWGTTSMSRI